MQNTSLLRRWIICLEVLCLLKKRGWVRLWQSHFGMFYSSVYSLTAFFVHDGFLCFAILLPPPCVPYTPCIPWVCLPSTADWNNSRHLTQAGPVRGPCQWTWNRKRDKERMWKAASEKALPLECGQNLVSHLYRMCKSNQMSLSRFGYKKTATSILLSLSCSIW